MLSLDVQELLKQNKLKEAIQVIADRLEEKLEN